MSKRDPDGFNVTCNGCGKEHIIILKSDDLGPGNAIICTCGSCVVIEEIGQLPNGDFSVDTLQGTITNEVRARVKKEFDHDHRN